MRSRVSGGSAAEGAKSAHQRGYEECIGLSERIQWARENAGINRATLARRIKISQTAIQFLETGLSKDVAGVNLFPLADAMRVNARWLITGRGSPNQDVGLGDSERDESILRLAAQLVKADPEDLQAVMRLLRL